MIGKIARSLAGTKIIRKVLENPADLSEFSRHPSSRVVIGLIVIGLSYVMGWPAVAACALLAAYFEDAWIAAIGPVFYGLSYLVFLLGAWMARAPHYLSVLVRYAVWAIFRKALRSEKVSAYDRRGPE